jgi:hypothetical protein
MDMMFSLCRVFPASKIMNVTTDPKHPTDERDKQIMDRMPSSVNDFKEIAVFTPCKY